ncbi:MAG: hypothetical protein AB2693_21125 [Candidatus Thiodiazotropha sp.]
MDSYQLYMNLHMLSVEINFSPVRVAAFENSFIYQGSNYEPAKFVSLIKMMATETHTSYLFQIRYALNKNGQEVAYFIFNGTGSEALDDWFKNENFLKSSWPSLNEDHIGSFDMVKVKYELLVLFIEMHVVQKNNI